MNPAKDAKDTSSSASEPTPTVTISTPSEEDPKKPNVWHQTKESFKGAFNAVTSVVRVNSFRQQKLPAWRPTLTNNSVITTFVLASCALIVIGAGFLYVSDTNQIFTLEYTQCMPLSGSRTCAQVLSDWQARSNGSWPPPECTCWYKFTLEDDFIANVYLYYALTNYFQNHLHYVRSRDDNQFRGLRSDASDCDPFRTKPVAVAKGKVVNQPIVPCGIIANSFFNDTFSLWFINRSATIEVPLLRTGIAWKSDFSRFKNPPNRSVFANFTNPPYWGNRTIWDLDPANSSNNGIRNEALIVWMRVSAFPDFRKLYARVNHAKTSSFAQLIPSGQYYLKINYNYPVTAFAGRKSFILANTNKTLGGGSYFFLAIIYLVVGGLCAISAVMLGIIHARFGVSKEEYMDINETTPYFFNRNGKTKVLEKR